MTAGREMSGLLTESSIAGRFGRLFLKKFNRFG